jgi:hypothetical protein
MAPPGVKIVVRVSGGGAPLCASRPLVRRRNKKKDIADAPDMCKTIHNRVLSGKKSGSGSCAIEGAGGTEPVAWWSRSIVTSVTRPVKPVSRVQVLWGS